LQVENGATAKFPFALIEGNPSLTVRPATDVNVPFFNAILSRDKSAEREIAKGSDVTDEQMNAVRLKDIDLFVEFIVIDWENVLDSKGKKVKFTQDNCREFLLAIPVDMFNQLRLFCLNINNFRNRAVMSDEELKALSGN